MKQRQQLFLLTMALTLLICCVSNADKVQDNHYTTTYGAICKDTCEKHDYKYFWCHTRNGWDYCSPGENREIYDDECKEEHPCGKHGHDYYWCYTKCPSVEWAECGPVEPKSVTYISSKHQGMCKDDCVYDAKYEYFWCYVDQTWDYCSPIHDVTYQNEPCLPEHRCGTHGYSYTWCYTKSGWDYCGVVKPAECTYYDLPSQRKKRQTHGSNMFATCTRIIKGHEIVTTFTAEPNSNFLADVGSLRKEITHLISRWENEYLEENQDELITSDHFCISKNNFSKMRDQRSYILEVQKKDDKTKVAQIYVSENVLTPVNNQYMRMAFLNSLYRRSKVNVEVKKKRK